VKRQKIPQEFIHNFLSSLSAKFIQLNGFVKEPNISIYFFFLPITQWCSVSDVLFTGGTGVSDFSILKYY